MRPTYDIMLQSIRNCAITSCRHAVKRCARERILLVIIFVGCGLLLMAKQNSPTFNLNILKHNLVVEHKNVAKINADSLHRVNVTSVAHDDQILDEILRDLQSSLLRLQATHNQDIAGKTTYQENIKLQASMETVQQLFESSVSIRKHANVFIEIGKILEKNSDANNVEGSDDATDADKPVTEHVAIAGKDSAVKTEPAVVYTYPNRPDVTLVEYDYTATKFKRPYGYDRRSATNMVLSVASLERLKRAVERSALHSNSTSQPRKLSILNRR